MRLVLLTLGVLAAYGLLMIPVALTVGKFLSGSRGQGDERGQR
jgi:lipid-binding SYLF domain-containing protein